MSRSLAVLPEKVTGYAYAPLCSIVGFYTRRQLGRPSRNVDYNYALRNFE